MAFKTLLPAGTAYQPTGLLPVDERNSAVHASLHFFCLAVKLVWRSKINKMKRLFPIAVLLAAALCSCGWAINDQNTIDISLPRTYSPAQLVGEWASGYTNFTQVIDAYNGRYLENTWQSGKYFKITDDGRNSEAYFMAKSQFASTATKITGTIRFDVGSTAESGAFTLLALKAHYKGWGSVTVDREATEDELKNNLTGKYYYRAENGWIRIEPGKEVGPYASSFKRL